MDAKDIEPKERNDRFTDVAIFIVRMVFVGIFSTFVCIPFAFVYVLFNEIIDSTFEIWSKNTFKVLCGIYIFVYLFIWWQLIVRNSKSPTDGV